MYSERERRLVILVKALAVSFSELNYLSLMVILTPGVLTLIASSCYLWLSRLTLTCPTILSSSACAEDLVQLLCLFFFSLSTYSSLTVTLIFSRTEEGTFLLASSIIFRFFFFQSYSKCLSPAKTCGTLLNFFSLPFSNLVSSPSKSNITSSTSRLTGVLYLTWISCANFLARSSNSFFFISRQASIYRLSCSPSPILKGTKLELLGQKDKALDGSMLSDRSALEMRLNLLLRQLSATRDEAQLWFSSVTCVGWSRDLESQMAMRLSVGMEDTSCTSSMLVWLTVMTSCSLISSISLDSWSTEQRFILAKRAARLAISLFIL